MPIENDGGVLIVRGYMAHQCTIEESILAIEVGHNKLHVAIKSNDFRGKYKTWSEGGGFPAALRERCSSLVVRAASMLNPSALDTFRHDLRN